MLYFATKYLKNSKDILGVYAIHSYIFLLLSSAWLETSLLCHCKLDQTMIIFFFYVLSLIPVILSQCILIICWAISFLFMEFRVTEAYGYFAVDFSERRIVPLLTYRIILPMFTKVSVASILNLKSYISFYLCQFYS